MTKQDRPWICESCNRKNDATDLVCAYGCESKRPERLNVQKPKPITMSQHKMEQLKEYEPLKRKFIIDNPICKANLEGCTKKTTEPHHCSMSDLDFLNVETWLATCRHCHNYIEREMSAEDRRTQGFLIDVREKKTV
jgi:hypothetical protein